VDCYENKKSDVAILGGKLRLHLLVYILDNSCAFGYVVKLFL
jgi:hypothetical protein